MAQPTSPPPSSTFRQNVNDLGSLRRSSDNRALAGVAEGLSRHFDIDPVIVRVLFAALTLFGGAGVILYLALWLTVPRDGAAHSIMSRRLRRDPRAWVTVGLGVGGILAAAALLGSISWAVPHPFPLLVLLLVAVFAYMTLARRNDGSSQELPPPPSPASGGPAPVQSEAAAASPMGGFPPVPAQTPAAASPAWWQRGDGPPTGSTAPLLTPPPPPARRPRSHLFGLTMAIIAIVLGGLWIFDATSSYDLPLSAYPGTALALIAIGLLAGSWWGRSRGLIAVGVLASLLTAGTAVAGDGPNGDVVATPTSSSQLRPTYSLGAGSLRLRLDEITDPATVDGRTITIDAHVGRVLVVLPSSIAATIAATVDHGRIEGPRDVLTRDSGGEHVDMSPSSDGRPAVTIRIHLRFGQIQIDRAACPGAGSPATGETTSSWNGGPRVPAACN